MENPTENRRSGRWLSLLVIIIMVVLAAVLLLQRCSREPSSPDRLEESVKAKLGQLDGKSEEEIQAELNRVIEEGMFHIAINTQPIFTSGTAEGNLEIENVPGNLYDMAVVIEDKETGEELYSSGLIRPNYHIERDCLEKELSPGEYPAVAVFHAYDQETMEEVGSTACEMVITVLDQDK